MIVVAVLVPLVVVGLAHVLSRSPVGGRVVERFGPMIAGLLSVALVGPLLMGLGGTDLATPVMLVAVAVTAAGALAVTRSRARRGAEVPWSGALAGAAVAAAPAGGPAPPTVDHPPAGAQGTEPSAAAVARALGRVEARELARSAPFGVGVGFCVLIVLLFGFAWASPNSETWTEFIQLGPWFAHPLVGMTVVAAHRAVTRARRDGARELFDTCPATASTRTSGFLLSAVTPVVSLAIFFVVLLAATVVNSPYIHGSISAVSAADLLASLALGAGGVALGVALGTWVRFTLAAVVAVVAVGFVTSALNGVGAPNWNPLVQLSTAPTLEGPSPVFEHRAVWWHLLWILGLIAVVAVVAIAHDRRDRPVALAAVAAIAVVVVAGVGAVRPMSPSSAEHLADVVARPQAHQTCESTGGPVQVCVFPMHQDLVPRVLERIDPIVAVLPDDVEPLTLRQAYDGDLDNLPPEVRSRLTESDLEQPARDVPLGFGEELLEVQNDPGFDLAFAVVGLPHLPDANLVPEVIAGQARGVVAVWLASRGLEGDRLHDATTAADPSSSDPFERGSLQTGACSEPSVVWSAQDLAAARTLTNMPDAEVEPVLMGDLDHWSDPATSTAELLAAFDHDGFGPHDQIRPRPGEPC